MNQEPTNYPQIFGKVLPQSAVEEVTKKTASPALEKVSGVSFTAISDGLNRGDLIRAMAKIGKVRGNNDKAPNASSLTFLRKTIESLNRRYSNNGIARKPILSRRV